MTTVAPSPPLVETKLRPPATRPGHVPRPDLLARLDDAAGRRLTLVAAPAGWGKTTLVGDWLARRGEGAGWVALDPGDDDPARFWRYVAEALRRAGVPLDDQAVGALGAEGDTFDAGLSALVNAAAALPRPAVLALDDYHAVTSPRVHAAVAALLERLPDGLRLVMTTRSDPPIGLARLRAHGDLAEIRAPDLRFTGDEAAALLRAATGAALDEGEVEALRRRTEGWAAGLYLAALSLRERDDAGRFIEAFAGDDRLVVDYLASEVLEGLPDAHRRFLLRTSVLARLCGPLCDAVAGTEGSARLLGALERSNLFLVPLDNRREWYRYHHLFGELLQHELALTAPGEIPELHRRACAWHREHGLVEEAVRHALAAGDVAVAAELVAANWSQQLRSGYTGTAQGWLDALPPEVVAADPCLCMAGAWIAVNLGRPDDAARWLAAAEAALTGPADPELAGSMLAARSLERLLAGDVDAAIALGREAVAATADPGSWMRAAACLSLGIALHAADDLPTSRPVLEEAVTVGRATGSWAPALVALCHLVEHAMAAGDVDGAEALAREALAYAADERHAEYPHAAGAHTGLARVLAARGDAEGALREAERGVELARRGRAPTEIAYSVLVRGEVALAAGDVPAARAAAREARGLLTGAAGARRLTAALLQLEAATREAPTPPAGDAGELTERELTVLRLLGGLASAREIAAELYVSHNTVKTQIRSIYRKLGVATRAEAVARARERGLLGGRAG